MAVDHGELRREGVPALPVFRAFVGLLGLCIDGCWDVRRIGAAHPHPLRWSPRQRGEVEEKGKEEEYQLYAPVERLAKQVIGEKRKIYKGVSANIDFYSGFIYSMLGLPHQLYTPLFAIARIVGWSAHRMEELMNGNRIIRPAYKAVAPHREYTPIDER